MTSAHETLQRARTLISENDLTTAEEELLDALSKQPPNLEVYNCLMEVYFRRDMFDKVAEYFKETTVKFPSVDLNSYFMIANHLFSKNALNETELILFLALQNHPDQRPIIANKLMELYLHPSVPGIVAFNYIKDNFNLLSLSSEMCQEIFDRLLTAGAVKEHKDFFLFLFAISVNNTKQKELFAKQYLSGIQTPESARTTLEELVTHSSLVEVSIYLTFATTLAERGFSEEARQVLALAEAKIPDEAECFTTAQILIANASDPTNITNELFSLVENSQFSRVTSLLKNFKLNDVTSYLKKLYPNIAMSKLPLQHYNLYSQTQVCIYYEILLQNSGETSKLVSNHEPNLLCKRISNDNPYTDALGIISMIREYYESLIYPDRAQWKETKFVNSDIPIEYPTIGILNNKPSTKSVPNAKSFTNKFGLYDNNNALIPESFHFSSIGTQLKPCDPEFSKPLTLRNQEREFTNIDEPVLFLGYTFHGHDYGHFLLDSLNCAWYLAENDWKGKVYFQFLVDSAPCGIFDSDIFQPLAIELLELAGIDRSRIILANQDINFTNEVLIPEAGYRSNSYGYKSSLSIFKKIAEEALKQPITENVFDIIKNSKIYLSHSKLTDDRRLIIGEQLLEKCLIDNGFSIVHPQDLTVSELIQIFNKVDTIVGTMSNELHTVLFCQNTPKIHTLCPTYVSTNYTLTNTLVGITEQYYHNVLKTTESTLLHESGYYTPNYLDIEETIVSLISTGTIESTYKLESSNAMVEELVNLYITSKTAP